MLWTKEKPIPEEGDGSSFDLLFLLVADSHCSAAMSAGVLQVAGLEEVLHCRMTVGALHGLHIMVNKRWTLCRGYARDFHHDHFTLIAHHSSLLWRCCEGLRGQDGEQSHHSCY